MLNALISAVLQTLAVLLVAGIVYLLFGRKTGSFARYIGLIPTSVRASILALVVAAIAASIMVLVPQVREAGAGEHSVVGAALSGGFTPTAMGVLTIKALFQTSLSEEILFRGLIGKRLIKGLGFATGNTIQAALFGAMHLLLFLIPQAKTEVVLGMVAFTFVGGWTSGWLNEKLGGGSILPGWIVHGAANLVAYFAFAALSAGLLSLP